MPGHPVSQAMPQTMMPGQPVMQAPGVANMGAAAMAANIIILFIVPAIRRFSHQAQ